jgi:hypothetical protein
MTKYRILERKKMIINIYSKYVEITRYYVEEKYWAGWHDVSSCSDGYPTIKDAQQRIAHLEYIPTEKVIGHFEFKKP